MMTNSERNRAIQKVAQTFMEDDMDNPIWPDEDHKLGWDTCVVELTNELDSAIQDRWIQFRANRKALVS